MKMKLLSNFFIQLFLIGILISVTSCNSNQKTKTAKTIDSYQKGTYGFDLKLLKEHSSPVELKNGNARIIISPEYQGRVMTSSSNGETGKSYGWINHDLIASGQLKEHINAVGGEERFWLGPEGGQFSLFFQHGSTFEYINWQTPACIDTEKFDIVAANDSTAEFSKSVNLKNYSNFQFNFDVTRKISLMNEGRVKDELGISIPQGTKMVGYQTENQLKNTGQTAWAKETGLISVWLLGMFIPSDSVTVFVPFKTDAISDYIVKSDYFGAIPSDRLVVKNGMIFFKGDGKQRGKIGVPPQRALPVLGSYDAANKILTVVKCEIPEGVTDYVNSAWEMQKFPFKGDAVNAYNDGPLADGNQMGPFYELESSSPAMALKPGEKAAYKQSTIHFEGSEDELSAICQQIFGISLDEVKAVF
jgi:hypothetical protein